MGILSGTDLVEIQREMSLADPFVTYTKPTVNAALQAIEDAMTTQTIPALAVGATIPAYLSSRIDTASSPYVFTNTQKRRLFAFWAFRKFLKDK